MRFTRRQFLKTTSIGGAVALLGSCATPFRRFESGANIGIIGVGYQGRILLEQLLTENRERIAFLCDVDSKRLAQALQVCRDQVGITPRGVENFNEVLQDKGVGAVVIATPDHWHSAMTLAALDADKHVFVEKSYCHFMDESFSVEEAMRRQRKLVQVGTNLRSNVKIQQAIFLTHQRPLKDIRRMKIRIYKPEPSITQLRKVAEASQINWSLWNGPISTKFSDQYLPHYRWHFYWATGGGHLVNYGSHLLDLVFWVFEGHQVPSNDMEIRIQTKGARLGTNDDGETPNVFIAEFNLNRIPIKIELVATPKIAPLVRQRTLSVEYDDQTLELNLDGKYRVLKKSPERIIESGWAPDRHIVNFMLAVAGQEALSSPLEKAHKSARLLQYINYCYRFGDVARSIPKSDFLNEVVDKGDIRLHEALDTIISEGDRLKSTEFIVRPNALVFPLQVPELMRRPNKPT